MIRLSCVVALGASSLGLGGCATVLNGTSQPVEFRSEPSGAQAQLVSPGLWENSMTMKGSGGSVTLEAAQSLTLAFNDIFQVMAWMFIAALVMVPFCRK